MLSVRLLIRYVLTFIAPTEIRFRRGLRAAKLSEKKKVDPKKGVFDQKTVTKIAWHTPQPTQLAQKLREIFFCGLRV